MAKFAETSDLEEFWRPLVGSETERADSLLMYASMLIRAEYEDLDDRIEATPAIADRAKFVAVSMVKRAMIGGLGGEGVAETQQSYGSIGLTSKFTNPTGNLYLTEAEKRLLSKSGPSRKAFSVNMVNQTAGTGIESLPYWGAEQP